MAFNSSKQGTPPAIVSEIDYDSIFTPAVELEKISCIHMGIYGRSGVGKTTFLLTCPRPCYIIDTEGSLKVNLSSRPDEEKKDLFIAEVIQYADREKGKINLVKSLEVLFKAIEHLTLVVSASSKDPEKPIGTICIDSGSDVWSWLGMWLEGQQTTDPGKRMMRTEWGKANKRYTEFIYTLLSSNWNFVMTFFAKPEVNEKGGDIAGSDTPQWQKYTERYLDISTELKRDGLGRHLIFHKCRPGDIDVDLDNPSWPSMIDHIERYTGARLCI